MMLDEPVWELGWCGLKWIDERQRINEIPLSMVTSQQEEGTVNGKNNSKEEKIVQKVTKVYVTADETLFQGKSVR